MASARCSGLRSGGGNVGTVRQNLVKMSGEAREYRPSHRKKFLAEAGRVPDVGGAWPGARRRAWRAVLRCRAGQQLARRQSVPSLAARSGLVYGTEQTAA